MWLSAVTGVESSVGNLYREVRSHLDSEKPTTESVLQDLHDYASAYQAIYGRLPVESPAMRVAYDRLDTLRILTAVPLLAWLRTLPEEQLSDDDHLRAVRAVESWAVRRMLMGWQTRGYGPYLVRGPAGRQGSGPSRPRHCGRRDHVPDDWGSPLAHR